MSETATTRVAPREVTEEEIATFDENGWVRLDQFITRDAAAELLAKSEELLGKEGEAPPRAGRDFDFSWYKDYQMPAQEGIEPFASLVYSPEIGRAAWRLSIRRENIGVRYWRDQIACRQPADSTEKRTMSNPHQDLVAHQFDRMGYVNFWIALNEVPPERGSMRFYSGSHRAGPLGWHDDGRFYQKTADHGDIAHVLTVYPELPERYPLSEPMHLMPGDATAHNMLVIHQARVNTTSTARWSVISLYFPEDAKFVGGVAVDPAITSGAIKPGQTFDHPDFPVVWSPRPDWTPTGPNRGVQATA